MLRGSTRMGIELVNRVHTAKVAVIGDIMIDVYLNGGVNRISPEAPVPVVKWVSERSVPGGAANVLANLVSIGTRASLVGVIGDDGGDRDLAELLLRAGGADLSGVVVDRTRQTIRKTRVLGQHQQLMRIDREDTHPLSAAIEDELIAKAIAAAEASDIVVLSDYGKGVLSDRVLRTVIDHVNGLRKKILVDPKRQDFAAYRGATILTPNRAELTLATGLRCESDEEAEAAVRRAQERCPADIVLTRAEKGISLFPREGAPTHVPTVAREVFDVSGAGDTVAALLAAVLASSDDVVAAMKVANHAAGIVVGKAGTATLTHAELLASLATSPIEREIDGHLVDLTEALVLRSAWREAGYTVGVANGCFDLLHPGHVSLIRQAAENCDRLIMALNSDASVKRLKGPTRPVQNERARAEVVGAVKGVALVVLFDEDTPHEFIKAVQPDVLIKGADYAGKEVVGAEIVEARGGKLVLAQLVDGQSTSRLIAAAK